MKTSDVEWGYLAHPDPPNDPKSGPGTHPGVVLIHDVWGLGELYREFARRLAQEGFAALALDLYRRPVEIQDPGAWMRALSDPEILTDVQAAADFLAAHPAVKGRGVGVTGFCMGGGYALLAACRGFGLSACVAYYGLLSYDHGILHAPEGRNRARKPESPLEAIAALRCPTLAIYGDQDEFVPGEDVRRLETALRGAGGPHEVRVYPGSGHAFLNEARPQAFRPEAARDAWARMLAFFRRHLA